MPQNSDNSSANPTKNLPDARHAYTQRDYGTKSMLPKKPSFQVESSSQAQPPQSIPSISKPDVIIRTSINPPSSSTGVTTLAGGAKGEDHDPNLEHLQRVNRPPAVISTSAPTRRRGGARRGSAQVGRSKDSNSRRRPISNGFRKRERSDTTRVQRSENAQTSESKQINPREPQTNNNDSLSDMDIDEIDAFSPPHMSSSSNPPTLGTNTVRPFKTALPSTSGAGGSVNYRGTASDSGDRRMSPENSHRSLSTPFSSTGASTRTTQDSFTGFLPLRTLVRGWNPSRVQGRKRSLEPSEVSDEAKTPKRQRDSSYEQKAKDCNSSGRLEQPALRGASTSRRSVDIPADMSTRREESHSTHVRRAHQAHFDMDDGHSDHLQPRPTGGPQPKQTRFSENTSRPTDEFKQEQSYSHAPTTESVALVPPVRPPVSSHSAEPEKTMTPSQPDPVIKEESPPPRSVSPIDVDAPPLSLYDQLGLPNRTSGALRVPRPRFSKDEQAKKEKWSKDMADSIRWVRGRGTNLPPLIVGSIFWRPDGVSFDWEVPPEGPILPAVESTGSFAISGTLHNSPHIENQLASDAIVPLEVNNKAPGGYPDKRIGAVTMPQGSFPSGKALSAPIVKEEVVETSLRSPTIDPIGARETRTLNPSSDTGIDVDRSVASSGHDIPQNSDDAPVLQNIPESLPVIPTNPAFDSPDAISNIATCFLDRYTRCFDHVKSRGKLAEAYTSDAYMSLQFNDLPSEGSCPRVGQPKKQSHTIVNFAEREHGRNLLLDSDRDPKDRQYKSRIKSSLCIGPQAIASRLAAFEALTHTISPSSSRAYHFVATPLKELGLLLLDYSGELFATKANSDERYISSRFQRAFVIKPNEPDAASW
ncbi:hypothetical protein M408DRAFT_5952 [Serendipita vermifera MAFF 305830]|uniref:NTF2 domain-containing protein n=1 Tax=Serendipita vermifera MAFF 305830 TaxID=933852 RepID=A0A0C3BMW5_SERVB|nr:hypothetical protein M408DRAFT_5952 [Serendipita vermifera MAFF 305830]